MSKVVSIVKERLTHCVSVHILDLMGHDVKHKKDFSYISPSHIRAARAWLGWTLDETGKKTGLSRKTIWRYEVSKARITDESASRIHAVFLESGIELSYDGLRVA